MPDILKDVTAALCQVARDYSKARSLDNRAAADNWKRVFGIVLDARTASAGRGAALAAFRAEKCPGTDHAHVDELAPPPQGTVSLSGGTLRWLVEMSGMDAAEALSAPDDAWDRYVRAAVPRLGQASSEHAMAGAGARQALAWAATGGEGRKDVTLASLRRLVMSASESLARARPGRS